MVRLNEVPMGNSEQNETNKDDLRSNNEPQAEYTPIDKAPREMVHSLVEETEQLRSKLIGSIDTALQLVDELQNDKNNESSRDRLVNLSGELVVMLEQFTSNRREIVAAEGGNGLRVPLPLYNDRLFILDYEDTNNSDKLDDYSSHLRNARIFVNNEPRPTATEPPEEIDLIPIRQRRSQR